MLTYRKIKLDENGQKSLYLGRKEKNYSSKKNDIGLEKKQNDIQHNSLLLIL